jgi:hypothetical protein
MVAGSDQSTVGSGYPILCCECVEVCCLRLATRLAYGLFKLEFMPAYL